MTSELTPLLAAPIKSHLIIKITEDKILDQTPPELKTLTYEELLPFLIDPFWVRMRRLAIMFVTLVFLTLIFMAFITAAKYKRNLECPSVLVDTSTSSYLLGTTKFDDLTKV